MKHVIVTGGASGIGKAIVQDFISSGDKVSVLDVKPSYEFLSQEVRLRRYEIDISREKDVRQLFSSGEFSNVDVLINNAGIDLPVNLMSTNANWDEVISTNLNGTKYVTSEVLKRMPMHETKKSGGSIIFITSVHTASAFKGGAAYDASKHALIGLMRVIALEYGKYGIKSNAISPGFIYPTGITKRLSERRVKQLEKKIPLQRAGTPQDVANIVSFLVSEQASYINGAEIRVDGGLAIRNALL